MTSRGGRDLDRGAIWKRSQEIGHLATGAGAITDEGVGGVAVERNVTAQEHDMTTIATIRRNWGAGGGPGASRSQTTGEGDWGGGGIVGSEASHVGEADGRVIVGEIGFQGSAVGAENGADASSVGCFRASEPDGGIVQAARESETGSSDFTAGAGATGVAEAIGADGASAGRKAVAIVASEDHRGLTDLAEIGGVDRATGGFTNLADGGNDDRSQDADDGDNREELDQSEAFCEALGGGSHRGDYEETNIRLSSSFTRRKSGAFAFLVDFQWAL